MNRNGVSKIGHVGLYIGNGRMLHTYRPENEVTISDINMEWIAKFIMAKRIV
jgi:cell wall-associated NlpC family hydrolase